MSKTEDLRERLSELEDDEFLILLYSSLASAAINLLARTQKHHPDFEWSFCLAIVKDILLTMDKEEMALSVLDTQSKAFESLNNLLDGPSPKTLLKHREEIEAEIERLTKYKS